jgi:pimeloyl-ACP methyl ester carboxylesterase
VIAVRVPRLRSIAVRVRCLQHRQPWRHQTGDHVGGRARILAVPGLGLSTEVARRALEPLPAPWSVVLLPAFGRPAPRGRRRAALAPERLAALLLAVLPSHAGGPVVLIGHSASCQVVAEAAARAPESVAALVLVGPTTDPRAAAWPALAARWLRTAAHERPSQVPLLVRAYARTGLVSMARGMQAARHHRLDSTLAAVACPVLVVRGRHDAICPPDWAAALAASAAAGHAETLPAGGHMVPITHADALAARIAAFLADQAVSR